MKWEKRSLIYCPNGEHDWEINTFMTPHAILIGDKIRIYGGVRDAEGMSRIKYIEVNADNPSEVLYVSDKPCFDIGAPGTFDDNGMILGDILPVDNEYWMYYVGFQHVQKAKFYAFSGLAISRDGGESFQRYSEVPVMDRTDKGKFGRCIHTVLHEDNIFKIYYAVIHSWKFINNIPYPSYNIWYTESEDGIHIPDRDERLCVDVIGNEYRIGRPKVYRTEKGYEMLYTRDLVTKEYLAGYAVSDDGINWVRKDKELNLSTSRFGFDSEMACYPVKLDYRNKTYLFYNGNGMGKTGVGYMEMNKNSRGGGEQLAFAILEVPYISNNNFNMLFCSLFLLLKFYSRRVNKK